MLAGGWRRRDGPRDTPGGVRGQGDVDRRAEIGLSGPVAGPEAADGRRLYS